MQYNRQKFVRKFAKNADLTVRDADYVYDRFLATLNECLHEGNGVSFHGIGRFVVSTMPKKTLKHPITGEDLEMPEYTRAMFHIAPDLKKELREIVLPAKE